MNRKERRRQRKVKGKSGGPPPEAVTLLDRAFAHQQAGQLEEAAAHYRQALAIDPSCAQGHNNLGVVLKDLGHLDEAVTHHGAALKINPTDADAYYNLGLALTGQGRFDEARAHYKKALKLNPNDAAAHHNLGAVLVKQGRPEEAERSFGKALEANPDSAEFHNSFGAVLIGQGRLDEAAGCFLAALNIDPLHVEANHNLGATFMEKNQMDEAIGCFRKVLEIDPGHANTHNNLGIVLMVEGRDEEALAAFRRGLELEPSNASASHMVAAMSGETTETAPPDFVRKLFAVYAPRFDEHLVDDLGYKVPTLMCEAVGKVADQGELFVRGLDLGCGTGLVAEVFADRIEEIDGIDLSPSMLERATSKNLYSTVHLGDIHEVLQSLEFEQVHYDLVLAADTFVYIGDLARVFAAVKRVTTVEGRFVFSVEGLDDGAYVLRTSGRYAHSDAYIEALASDTGFTIEFRQPVTVRTENEFPIGGTIFILRITSPK